MRLKWIDDHKISFETSLVEIKPIFRHKTELQKRRQMNTFSGNLEKKIELFFHYKVKWKTFVWDLACWNWWTIFWNISFVVTSYVHCRQNRHLTIKNIEATSKLFEYHKSGLQDIPFELWIASFRCTSPNPHILYPKRGTLAVFMWSLSNARNV